MLATSSLHFQLSPHKSELSTITGVQSYEHHGILRPKATSVAKLLLLQHFLWMLFAKWVIWLLSAVRFCTDWSNPRHTSVESMNFTGTYFFFRTPISSHPYATHHKLFSLSAASNGRNSVCKASIVRIFSWMVSTLVWKGYHPDGSCSQGNTLCRRFYSQRRSMIHPESRRRTKCGRGHPRYSPY